MAEVVLCGAVSLSINASSTTYFPVGISCGDRIATEANVQHPFPAGFWRGLYAVITNNDRGASTIKSRVAGADGAQILSIGASTTGQFEDTTGVDTITAGALLTLQVVTGAGGTIYRIYGISTKFRAVGQTVCKYTVDSFNAIATASTTFFGPIAGQTAAGWTTTAANAQTLVRTSMTFSAFWIKVSTNARSTTSTYGFYKNSGAGNQTVSVTAGATGIFEDTTNSDAVVSGDLVCIYATLGTGTGNLAFQNATTQSSTGNKCFIICSGVGATPAGVVYNASTTTYVPMSSANTGSIGGSATESDVRADARIGMRLANFTSYVSVNTVTATSTITLRINGADATQTLSIASSTTGRTEDSTHVDNVIPTDELNYVVATGASGTSMSVQTVGILAQAKEPRIYRAGMVM